VAKLTKAQAKKRMEEARSKVYLVVSSGHITIDRASKLINMIDATIRTLEKK